MTGKARAARVLGLLSTLALLASAATAGAEEPYDLEAALYAGGGLSIPLTPSDFVDGWEQGWNAGGGIGYRLSPRSEIRALFFYNRFDLKTSTLSGVSGGAYTLLEGAVDYKLYLTGLRPDEWLAAYVVGGAGFGGQTIAATSFPAPLGTTQKFTRTKLAFDLGAGVDFLVLPRTGLFVEAKWILLLTRDENTTHLPLRAGVRFLVSE